MGLHRPGAPRVREALPARGRRPLLGTKLPPRRAPRLRDPELEAMRAADRARDLDLHPLSARNKRRWKLYVLGAMIFFPLVTYVLTETGLRALWFQLPVAALYGTYVAYARPSAVPAALATVAAGVLTQLVAGVSRNDVHGLVFVLGLILYLAVGLVVGVTETSNHVNGE